MRASKPDPKTLWMTAVSLEEAGILLHQKADVRGAFVYLPRLPVVFLFYRSIELALKAFLLVAGVSLDDLRNPRKFGHRIDRLYAAAASHSIKIDPPPTKTDLEILTEISMTYSDKRYEYPADLFIKVPMLVDLRNLCRRIVSAAEGTAFGDGRRKSDKLLARHL